MRFCMKPSYKLLGNKPLNIHFNMATCSQMCDAEDQYYDKSL